MERYDEVEPPDALRPWVRRIWTYASLSPSQTPQRIAPDGCPELIIDLGAPYEEAGPDCIFRSQPSRVFAGQMTRPMAIRPLGPVELVAVRFEPDGARDWFGMSLSIATDKRLDVADRLKTLGVAAGDPGRQVTTIADWLEVRRREEGWTIDRAVRAQVEALESDLPISARSSSEQRALQRRFAERVGVSPRMLRSVFRFRRVFDNVTERGAGAIDWLEAGISAGYFDQPQMARDFRRFLGCTATVWARDQVELARHIASQTYKSEAISSR